MRGPHVSSPFVGHPSPGVIGFRVDPELVEDLLDHWVDLPLMAIEVEVGQPIGVGSTLLTEPDAPLDAVPLFSGDRTDVWKLLVEGSNRGGDVYCSSRHDYILFYFLITTDGVQRRWSDSDP
jgi:hypothetical protein